MNKFKYSLAVMPMIFLSACSGGSDSANTSSNAVSNPQTSTGVFKDGTVAGISYSVGDKKGTTNSKGEFTFETGLPVTFSIGGVTLGSATGADLITPLNLVDGGSLDSNSVQNMVRFLMLIDSDGDPSNGINIDNTTQGLAKNWPSVDFSVDISGQLNAIKSDLATLFGNRDLPTAAEARKHLSSTLSCSYGGAFSGQRDGVPFGFVVAPKGGKVSVFAKYMVGGNEYILEQFDIDALEFAKQPSLSLQKNLGFAGINTDVTLNAKFNTLDSFEGTWTDALFSGKFSGQRLLSSSAKYRVSGTMRGSEKHGVFDIQLNGSDIANGKLFLVGNGTSHDLKGKLKGTELELTADNGLSLSISLATGIDNLTGSWVGNDKERGTLSASGCLTEQVVVKDYCDLLDNGQKLTYLRSQATPVIQNYLKNNPFTLSSNKALAGLGNEIVVTDVNNMDAFLYYTVNDNNKLLPSSPEFMATTKVSIKDDGPAITGAILSSAVQDSDLNVTMTASQDLLSYTCDKNILTLSGTSSASGSGDISALVQGASIKVNVDIKAGADIDKKFKLSESPAGGLLMHKVSQPK